MDFIIFFLSKNTYLIRHGDVDVFGESVTLAESEGGILDQIEGPELSERHEELLYLHTFGHGQYGRQRESENAPKLKKKKTKSIPKKTITDIYKVESL